MMLLFASIAFLGVTINLLSTHRAVIKYLKMKLDELY
jgi:cell division transport system permease protein